MCIVRSASKQASSACKIVQMSDRRHKKTRLMEGEAERTDKLMRDKQERIQAASWGQHVNLSHRLMLIPQPNTPELSIIRDWKSDYRTAVVVKFWASSSNWTAEHTVAGVGDGLFGCAGFLIGWR